MLQNPFPQPGSRYDEIKREQNLAPPSSSSFWKLSTQGDYTPTALSFLIQTAHVPSTSTAWWVSVPWSSLWGSDGRRGGGISLPLGASTTPDSRAPSELPPTPGCATTSLTCTGDCQNLAWAWPVPLFLAIVELPQHAARGARSSLGFPTRA